MNNPKYLLVGVNAKYIHTSLSVRTLSAYCGNIPWVEYTINEDSASVCADIYFRKADMVLFSCYIWNIEYILRTARRLKSVAPHTKIVLGGPEVSYSAEKYLEENTFVDAVIRGEGEETVRRIVQTGTLEHKGVTYRSDGRIISLEPRALITDISKIPFPYTDEDIENNKHRLIYYETSRGCPFNCSYCLSSTEHSVRFRDLRLVFDEMKYFIDKGVKIVKLTDRTFNAHRERTHKILRFLIEHAGKTTFHFEVAADLLDTETLELLKTAPKGLFQLEIGVQSTNDRTLAAINRKTDIEKISEAVRKIRSFGNIHTHLDLIAGLPHEDFESFRNSFNCVYKMRPHVIQLGFLKLLHGTEIRRTSSGTIFTAEPPYEVLQTPYISYDELIRLKRIEDIAEKYYNSLAFERSVEFLAEHFDEPFDMFSALADFYGKNGFERIGISRDRLYEILLRFAEENGCDMRHFRDLLLFDYLSSNKPRTPSWAQRKPVTAERFEILTEDFIARQLPEYAGMSAKEIVKHIHFERFYEPERILLFDPHYSRIITVTQNALKSGA